MKFQVQITETLQRLVEVNAETAEDAETIARMQYRSENIVLSPVDFNGVDFEVHASGKDPCA